MTAAGPITIAHLSPEQMRDLVGDAMAIYERAMNYQRGAGVQRRGHAIAHTRLPGYRATAAFSERGELTGFGYGYTSRPGQWWHDQVRAAAGPHLAALWLADAFELCEFHVAPPYQGQGIGRRLLLALAGVVAERRVLLSTPEGPTRAWRLYLGVGFEPLVRDYRFPGDGRLFAILGAGLPLPTTDPEGRW